MRLPLAISLSHATAITLTLIVANFCFNVLANASFTYAALGGGWQRFLAWQVIGNLAGFITVITLTLLLRYMPHHVAFPLTTGLALIGVQVVAALILFGEKISVRQ